MSVLESLARKVWEASHHTTGQDKTIAIVDQLLRDGSTYRDSDAEPGDVLFYCNGKTGIGHANMVGFDRKYKIDSVPSGGVRKTLLSTSPNDMIAFRCMDSIFAQDASLLMGQWVDKVGYSDGMRMLNAGFGSCHFGRGAVGRLEKYRNRGKNGGLSSPKNSTCAELCILAYQLRVPETSPFFPKLDAKNTSPARLVRYMHEHVGEWQYVGFRRGSD